MSAWLLVSLALAAATPGVETSLLEKAPALFAAGELTPAAEAAITAEAARLAGSQMTLVLCLGQETSPAGDAVAKVGDRAAGFVRTGAPKAQVQWTARELEPSACPKGVMLSSWKPPAAGLTFAVRALAGAVTAGGHEAKVGISVTLQAGAEVVTGADGMALVTLRPDLLLDLGPDARIGIKALDPEPVVIWIVGELEVRSTGSRSWRIEAPGEGPSVVVGPAKGSWHLGRGITGRAAAPRVESLGGAIPISRGDAKATVEPGRGAIVRNDEILRRPLPVSPTTLQPTGGKQALPLLLRWGAVEGATSYRVEVASDLQFRALVSSSRSDKPEVEIKTLPAGRLYWRVFSLDADGMASPPSALYGLEIEAAAKPK